MPRASLLAKIPVSIEFPEAMQDAVTYVLSGEYESGFDGHGLTILDIGANVGSFALWASLRWPGSTIHCYEPNPGTFAYLARNTAGHPNVRCVNAAVFPGGQNKASFFSRYAGDGEAGLLAYAGDTFREGVVEATFEVDVVAPSELPRADVIKLDIEGGEAEVLAALDLTGVSYVLGEFQNRRNRIAMQETLARAGFVAVRDEEAPWDPILDYKDYRADLKGDVYGHMFYQRKGQTRLVPAAPI
jgi:FkbM family methyltransferase